MGGTVRGCFQVGFIQKSANRSTTAIAQEPKRSTKGFDTGYGVGSEESERYANDGVNDDDSM